MEKAVYRQVLTTALGTKLETSLCYTDISLMMISLQRNNCAFSLAETPLP